MRKLVLAIIALQASAIGCHISRSNSAGADPAPFRAIHLKVDSHPGMLTIADVNKDGNLDVLVVGGNLSVFLGDEKGDFAPASGSPFPAGQNPADITTADLDGDGNLDVAIANHGVKFVTVLLGNGKGQ